jgi:hypothetical protein
MKRKNGARSRARPENCHLNPWLPPASYRDNNSRHPPSTRDLEWISPRDIQKRTGEVRRADSARPRRR